jgi:hypothetical protein
VLFPWKELVLIVAHHEGIICCIFSVGKFWVQYMESRKDWVHGMEGCTSHQKVIVWVMVDNTWNCESCMLQRALKAERDVSAKSDVLSILDVERQNTTIPKRFSPTTTHYNWF